MKYKNAPKLLAEEAWRMITDECKEKMASLKEHYIESLTEDISYFTNKITDEHAIDFVEWVDKNINGKIYTDYKKGSISTKMLLEMYKKEKGL